MLRREVFLAGIVSVVVVSFGMATLPDVAPRGAASVGSGKVSPDKKTELACDLPDELQMRNVGGSDGSGLCVFTSIMHSARWQHVAALEDFQAWMRKHPGGGWPEKVTQMIAQRCKEAGVIPPPYLQVESDDLEILKLACRCGRMPGITYNYSPTPGRYGGRIAHMVSLVHADDDWFAVLDNNYIGSANLQWMDPQTFKGVYTGGRGAKGWAVILLDPPPPPPPFN
jgi:hypothetical protein